MLGMGCSAFSQCLPPSAHANLDVNNVNARINMGESSWWDLQSAPRYEVPAGGGVNCFYAHSFWIGGIDEFGQPRFAGVRYRQYGYDFWPGPLSDDGSITPKACTDNDRIYKLNRWEVAEFRERFNTVGYVIPTDILEWPAKGNPNSKAHADAPFIDVNTDGIYNAYDGDYPAFAFDGPVDRNFHLLGDQCLWWVQNDNGYIHTETNGPSLGMELQCMAYAFATCDALNDQTFYRYKVINRSPYNYNDTYIGLYTDSDLGYAQDDYVQCEVMRHLGFTFNGFAVDGTGWPNQYGAHPPAAGIGILEGPLADADDGIDNDRDGTIDEIGEKVMMSRFLYISWVPQLPIEWEPNSWDNYNYMRGIWGDDSQVCYGGNGHWSNGGDPNIPCNFMFPGDSDPLGYGTGGVPQSIWTEQTAGNVPLDRRFIISCGPFTLNAGETDHIHYGALWARDTTQTDPFSSAEKLFEVKDLCDAEFQNGFEPSGCCPPTADLTYQQYSGYKFLFASKGEADSYHWDFGDGSSSTERFPPVHRFYCQGTYDVCLTVENDCGWDSVCTSVTIADPPLTVQLQRIEGYGNMGRYLELEDGMHDSLFVGSANRIYHPVYKFNQGPLRIEVLDSTLLPKEKMFIALDSAASGSRWKMYVGGQMDTVYSDSTIGVGMAQLVTQWGLLVQVKQVDDWNGDCDFVVGASIDQGDDPWLKWLQDTDYRTYSNWIRSGEVEDQDWPAASDYSHLGDNLDWNECFENILGGTWSPWKLVSHADSVASPAWSKFKSLNKLENLSSVDIIITADRTRWSRCPVVEIADSHLPSIGDARRFDLRHSPSVDKDGNPDGSGTMGMGWFPGYAVDVETGERLNMAFGENSWLAADHGADMLWNPTSKFAAPYGDPILGGGHYIYVFGHNGDVPEDDVPAYDEGQFIFERLSDNDYVPGDPAKRRVYKDAMWVGVPMLKEGEQLLQADVTIKLRVRKPFADYQCLDQVHNGTHPLYAFDPTRLGTGAPYPSPDEIDVLIYPNPVIDGSFTVLNRHKGIITGIELYGVNGQRFISQPTELDMLEAKRIDCSALSGGIYVIVVRSGTETMVRKLVIP